MAQKRVDRNIIRSDEGRGGGSTGAHRGARQLEGRKAGVIGLTEVEG